jgi:hypothetical protein
MSTKQSNATGVKAPSEAAVGALSIIVPFTTLDLTKLALKQAVTFGKALKAQIRLIDVHVVPFPCPLNEPLINRRFLVNRLYELADVSDLPVRAELILARDRMQTIGKTLSPESIVVIGTRNSWFPTAERKLARFLTRVGHKVVLLASR